MRLSIKKIILVLILVFLPFFFSGNVFAQDANEDRIRRLSEEISKYEAELGRLVSEANTLSNLINQYNTQIKLTQLKISQTEEKIILLGGRIEQLKDSLDALNLAYTQRVSETYKISRFSEPHLLFLSMSNITDAINSFNYLKKLQASDISLLGRLEKAQNTYQEEKSDQEVLQKELEVQNKSLSLQKNAKAKLLEQTRNDEKRYQSLLASAKAEYEAIQAIIAGKGQETAVGHIGEGERIASIIQGSSCNSNGTHLHFMIVENNVAKNPAEYLVSRSVEWDNSPDSPFSFSGYMQWPMSDPIRITQGFGWTYYADKLAYYMDKNGVKHPHSGIDFVSTDLSVKSVRAGTLYRGSYSIGCVLRYVRVDHDDSNIDSYYLHINY